jgi:GNAT superfamily N-acetyltransferase
VIVAITDDLAANGPLLAACEGLHRQLRPQIGDYVPYLTTMFAEGAEMAALVEDSPRALAVYRMYHSTYAGLRFYVDDLVTDETRRSAGHGEALIAWLEARARARGADTFALDSGVQRTRAHKFYFRVGLAIVSFAFAKPLKS